MQLDSNLTFILDKEADAALRATRSETNEVNAQRIATLREDASDGQIAEHIRGMVAATMANLSIHATDTTLQHANHWQKWALDAANDLAVAEDSMGTTIHRKV